MPRIPRASDDPTLPNTYPSCLPKEPLIKLDDAGSAPVLKYDLTQETCLDAQSSIIIMDDESVFKTEYKEAPAGDYFTVIDKLTPIEARSQILASLKPQSGNPLILNAHLLKGGFAKAVAKPIKKQLGYVDDNTIKRPGAGSAMYAKPDTDDDDDLTIAGESLKHMVTQVVAGKRPVAYTSPYGKVCIRYISKPVELKPRIYMIEHYKICNFLGDYGAGKVVKTFSLLPGEETTISMRSFKKTEEVRKRAENVIDSMSEDTMDELQNTVDSEVGFTSNSSSESTKTKTFGGGIKVKADIPGTPIGISGGGGYDQTNTKSVSNSRQNTVNTLTSALDKHVAQSNQSREVSVNTETSTSVTTEEENSTVRMVKNTNWSRVLNFVYRQLNQDWFSITYLNDVTFVFETGYPEHAKVVKLSDLNGLLNQVLEPGNVDNVRNAIYTELCSVRDYTETPTPFIEKVSYDMTNCIEGTTGTSQVFVRKRKDLSSTQTYLGKAVDGIILNVAHRTLRTDSIICDAMLGRGEALDCFNQRTQDAAALKTYLDNVAIDLQNEKQELINTFISATSDDVATTTNGTLINAFKDIANNCCNDQYGCDNDLRRSIITTA